MWLLSSKLIARKSQNLKSLIFIVLIDCGERSIIRFCQASLTCNINQQEAFRIFEGLKIHKLARQVLHFEAKETNHWKLEKYLLQIYIKWLGNRYMKVKYITQELNKPKMYNKMMLPIELTKILYSDWQGTISVSSQDSQIYGKCLNGPGSVTFKNGNRYEGNFYNGLLNGKGKFTWANGIIYQGQFTDNRITGKGIYKWPDGSIYEGQVKDGLRHGYGVYKIDDATYEGQWKEGKKQGKGKIVFKSGSIFEGNFKNDLKHGLGKMYYYPSGNYFEGNWQNDMKQGQGTMNWTDLREKYFGEWHKNYQHGWGVHIWLQSKGEGKYLRNRYEGNWANGVREGYGVFYYANGAKYQGYWKDNMKQGFAFYTNQNGKVSHLLFDRDRMLKSGSALQFEQNNKKVTSKKQVEPNAFSQCLQIEYMFYPFTPNLQALYNLLLRNNTQLKFWYKGLSNFYDQQSQYSFSLNQQGVWKMIRALKILGDISLASIDRGMRSLNPKIQQILQLTEGHIDSIDYQDIYYKNLVAKTQQIDFSHINAQKGQQWQKSSAPFNQNIVHNRQRNFLFRQFAHLLILIAYSLNPSIEKPQKSVQQLLSKISPMLETISKSIKPGTSDNISENMSSVSKGQKTISPHFRAVNKQLMQKLQIGSKPHRLNQLDLTVRIRELIGFGRQSGIFAESQFILLQRIVQKYMDNQILNRPKKNLWANSNFSTKLLNVLNYELVEYQFVQIIYFLIIKKLPSHKQTEQNKAKYQTFLQKLEEPLVSLNEKRQEERQFCNEARFLISQKQKKKQVLIAKRLQMQKTKKQQKQRQMRLERQEVERQLMAREDKDVKQEDFEDEESELDI